MAKELTKIDKSRRLARSGLGPQHHLRAAEKRELPIFSVLNNGVPNLCRASGMAGRSLAAQLAASRRAEKIRFQLDGREAFGAFWQMGDRCETGTGVRQGDKRGCMEKAVRRQHFRTDGQSSGKLTGGYSEHFDAEQARQKSFRACIQLGDAYSGAQCVTTHAIHSLATARPMTSR